MNTPPDLETIQTRAAWIDTMPDPITWLRAAEGDWPTREETYQYLDAIGEETVRIERETCTIEVEGQRMVCRRMPVYDDDRIALAPGPGHNTDPHEIESLVEQPGWELVQFRRTTPSNVNQWFETAWVRWQQTLLQISTGVYNVVWTLSHTPVRPTRTDIHTHTSPNKDDPDANCARWSNPAHLAWGWKRSRRAFHMPDRNDPGARVLYSYQWSPRGVRGFKDEGADQNYPDKLLFDPTRNWPEVTWGDLIEITWNQTPPDSDGADSSSETDTPPERTNPWAWYEARKGGMASRARIRRSRGRRDRRSTGVRSFIDAPPRHECLRHPHNQRG